MVDRSLDQGNTPALPLLTRLLRAGLVQALSLGSLFLALIPLFLGSEALSFFDRNALALPVRVGILAAAWGIAVVSMTALFLVWGRKGERGLARFETAARALCPFLVSAFVPALFVRSIWVGYDLQFLSYLLALGLGFERLLRVSLAEWARFHWVQKALGWLGDKTAGRRALQWIPLVVVLILAGWYVARIGTLTNIGHKKLMTASSDLAEYDNMFFNALHGHPWRSPAIAGHLKDFSTLQGHAEFVLYMLLPFYAIAPGASTLLWIQSVVVALTAVPIFLFVRNRWGSFCGLCFAVAYLFMPAVQQPNFYDFHFTPVGMFFAAWLMFFVARLLDAPRERTRRLVVYGVLAATLLCREDTSIGTAVLGTFLVLSGRLVRDGLGIAGISLVYFVGMKFGFMPLFGRWWFDDMYQNLKAPGAGGFGAVVLTLVSNLSYVVRTMLISDKLLYVLHMLVPVLALWLRRPLLWMAVLPGFVGTLLATNRPALYQANFQYTYSWVAYILCASALAHPRGLRALSSSLGMLLVAFVLSNQMGVFPRGETILGGFLSRTFEYEEADEQRYRQLRELVDMIPPGASVSATEAEGPHVSSRLVMYSLKYTLGHEPDYLLVRSPRIGGEPAHVRQALESGDYGVLAQRGPFVLAKRGFETKRNGILWRQVGGRPPPKGKVGPRKVRKKSKK